MRKHFEEIAAGKVETTAAISAVQRNSVDHFEQMKKKHWGEVIRGDGIKVLRVSNPSKTDYAGDVSDISSKCMP